MTILITGANGNVSTTPPRSLDSQDVRALVRDPAKAPEGVPVAMGDLDNPASLTSAFEGEDVLWLLTAMGPQAPHQSMNAVWAAQQATVKHVVRMSAIGAAYDAPTRNGRLHALSDAELAHSGLNWTIIRPASFMQNLIGSVIDGTLYGCHRRGPREHDRCTRYRRLRRPCPVRSCSSRRPDLHADWAGQLLSAMPRRR